MTADMQHGRPDSADWSGAAAVGAESCDGLNNSSAGSSSDSEEQLTRIRAEEISDRLDRIFAYQDSEEMPVPTEPGPEPLQWSHASPLPADRFSEASEVPEAEMQYYDENVYDDAVYSDDVMYTDDGMYSADTMYADDGMYSADTMYADDGMYSADTMYAGDAMYYDDAVYSEDGMYYEDTAPYDDGGAPFSDTAPVPVISEDQQEPVGENPARSSTASGRKHAEKSSRKQKKTPENPGVGYVKVDNSRMKVSTAEYVHQLRLNLQERQRACLPGPGASVKSALKHQEKLAGINRALKPFRLIMLVLMGLCAAGREYQWMTLGVMSGINGTYISIMMTFLAFLVNWQSVYRAWRDIRYARFSYESFLLVFSLLGMFEGYYYQNEQSLLPILTMAWCICGMRDLQENELKAKILRKLRYDRQKKSVRVAPKFWENTDAIGTAKGTYGNFVRHMEEPDVWHTLYSVFYPVFVFILLIASGIICAQKDTPFLSVLVQLFILGTPLALLQCNAKPFAAFVGRVRKHGVPAGWYGVRKLNGKKYVILNNETLFPQGTIHCEGFWTFAHVTESTLVSYAASLALEFDIGYRDAFVELMRETNGSLMKVDSCLAEEGGVRGIIHDDVVLVGSEQYMKLNGIVIPKSRHSYSIYLAVNGGLAGEFRMQYEGVQGAEKVSAAISRDFRLTTLITSANVYMNPKFLNQFFRMGLNRTVCPKSSTRRYLSGRSAFRDTPICGFLFQKGLTSYGQVIVGARRLYRIGLCLTILSMVMQCAVTIRSISVLLNGGTLISGAVLIALNILLAVVLDLISRIAFQF